MTRRALTPSEKSILTVCNDGYITLSEIVKKTGLSRKECEESIEKLWKQGLLEQEYGQQYVITSKGSDALLSQNDSVSNFVDGLLNSYSMFVNSSIYDEVLDKAFDMDLESPFQIPLELNKQVKTVVGKFLKEKFGE